MIISYNLHKSFPLPVGLEPYSIFCLKSMSKAGVNLLFWGWGWCWMSDKTSWKYLPLFLALSLAEGDSVCSGYCCDWDKFVLVFRDADDAWQSQNLKCLIERLKLCSKSKFQLLEVFPSVVVATQNMWLLLWRFCACRRWLVYQEVKSPHLQCNKYDHIRYVGVIWFIFHVLQLLPIRFAPKNLCCISKSTMNICKNQIGNRNSRDLVMVIASACLSIS